MLIRKLIIDIIGAMISDSLLNRKDIQRLIAACDDSRDTALVLVLLDTGMKLGEIELLQLSDIKWSEKRIKVPKRRGEYLSLSEPTWAVLKDWIEQRPPAPHKGVFVSLKGPSDPLSSRGIDHILRTLGEKSGVGKVSARRLRNTYLAESEVTADTSENSQVGKKSFETKKRFACPSKCKWVLGFFGLSFILGALFYLLLREED